MSDVRKAPSEFLVSELKEKLAVLGLATTGVKSELIARLMEADPSGNWVIGDSIARRDVEETRNTTVAAVSESIDELALLRREMEIFRKEKEIAEREVELARKEIEILRRTQSPAIGQSYGLEEANRPPAQTEINKLSLKAVTELIGYFEGEADEFTIWEDHVNYLRDMYHLTEDQAKVMIVQRLKGRALEWFRSRREYLHLTVDELLVELRKMFHQRISKMTLRTRFQERVWKRDEPFSDYFHEKIILANRIEIDDEEIIEFVIAGIPDQSLRDQARVHGHKRKESLLSAFEHISLQGRPQQAKMDNSTTRRSNIDASVRRKINNVSDNRLRCKNCGAMGHFSEECPYKSRGTKCFECREFGHIAVNCPRNRIINKDSCNITRSVRGSPRLKPNEIRFRGIGSEDNKTLGEFFAGIEIDGNQYTIEISVVPDTLMQHAVLIRTDFLDTVDINIREGKIAISKPSGSGENSEEVVEILKIDCVYDTNERKASYKRPRRLPPSERQEVENHISDWLSSGIIQPSLSEYASPVVLNANIFSTLDLKNGFFHVPLEPESRKYTSFIVCDGQYEFLYVPFGLCNSPAVFQKFINAAFRELIGKKIVLTYMDDLIIPSKDRESGIEYLQEVEFLGHVIVNGRNRPSRGKTEAVMKFPQPSSVKQIQSFLGLTGFFRKFIANYSLIARPLTDLLKADVKFEFGEKQKEAVEQLKRALSNKPVLNIYRVGAETELHTDASMYGYGAILLQRDENNDKFHPIYYASGKTTSTEAKYTSYELEVLAIIKALRKFRIYLLGIPFKIVTDCQAFSMTMNKKDLCVRVARWALLLEEF
ncbi:uncharacterized protein LOC122523751 [Polistes fuscatus]|uniref:uncharacterized protein LOC122523751 n=1 Tax=Polistes fuscatus TaxID=30207 RepID=UPI001CA9C06A|nr:uncharacterized protein LOC122523751 [Polistes fuscatus]